MEDKEIYKSLIKEYRNKLDTCAEELATNIPMIYELQSDGKYIISYDSDIWDIETVTQFVKHLNEHLPECTFAVLPKGMDIIDSKDIEKQKIEVSLC